MKFRSNSSSAVLFAFGWAFAMACASPPRPAILGRLAEVQGAPAVQQSERWAPQAHAEALRLGTLASKAFEAGDLEATETLSEGAIAGHEHAIVLARLAQAELRRQKAEAAREQAREKLMALHSQHQLLLSEATSFETRAQVLRAALPAAKLGRAGPKRRLARHRAAGALATQGRLLCVSARLLDPSPSITEALAALDDLEKRLALAARRDHLEDATRLRATCLSLLSAARQSKSELSQERTQAPPADVLLSQLSAAGFSPSRDERGVSLPLVEVFSEADTVSVEGLKTLKLLSETAKRRSRYPLLLVGHAGARGQQAQIGKQLERIKGVLEQAGTGQVVAFNAGMRQPLVPHGSPGSKRHNERLELIFVSPTW